MTDKDHNELKTGFDLEIRSMSDCEVEETFSLIHEEGWTITQNKFERIMEEFKGSTYVAVIDKEIVGAVLVLPSHGREYVLRNLVVANKYRRKGIGSILLKTILKIYEKFVIKFTTEPSTKVFYISMGFTEVGPTYDVFYISVDLSDLEEYHLPENDFTIKNFSQEMFDDLCHYDTSVRGYNMSRYLSVMVAVRDYFLALCFNSSQHVIGYTAFFLKGSVVIIDGLYADSDDIAFVLYRHILQALPERTQVRLKTVTPRLFLTRFGTDMTSKPRRLPRMANGTVSPILVEKLYVFTDSNCAL